VETSNAFNPGDHITPVIYDICDRYRVKIDWVQEETRENWTERLEEYCPDFSWSGPGDCGFSFKRQYIYACDANPAHVFHEFLHLILGKECLKLCEGYVLLPFEWEFAKWASRRMGVDRCWFMRLVDLYQQDTPVHYEQHRTAMFDANHRRNAWWHNGIRRVQALGLLDDRLAPTFQRPVWKGSGVKRAWTWSVATDHKWRPQKGWWT
jgi:hypothetical protein